ncbi:CMD domain protein [Roseococcus sp. SDR]|uniref:CMD domain protein n=1 Tax=Roseococcus sp. SDR TaxID=2835532 RepID=UPI001BCE2B63|nr:CMD domain protein [Roseococcus sp. SDR]MBS7791696.1 CMD domain protein [Roseococcus sp. SDR]MBV1847010.1 CMD domain protein [Roseococcus sp. SDR]
MSDLIDTLLGIEPQSPLATLRLQRHLTRTHTEESHRVLFRPETAGDVSIEERMALGTYVCALHGAQALLEHYATALANRGAVEAAAAQTRACGPTGHFPAGPLSAEDSPAPPFALAAETAATLGPRLVAAFAHAHMLVFHPRDASPAAFRPLLEAGWTTDGIVTLSQIVAFLSYQIRVVQGLGVLAGRL